MRPLLVLAVILGPLHAQEVFRTPVIGSPPATLDPQLLGDARALRYHAQLFEAPLHMGLDERGRCEIRPAVCRLPGISDDGLTLRLTVRSGIRFHDDPCFEEGRGREVTPEDLRFTFLRHADPETQSHYYGSFLSGRVAGLDAWRRRAEEDGVADYDAEVPGLSTDGDAFVIRLEAPYPQLPALLTQPWASVVPKEAVLRYGSGFGRSHPVGTGPFRYAGRDELGTVRLVRNPHYRVEGQPHLDEVRFEVVPDLETATARFLDGAVDVLAVWPQNEDRLLGPRGEVRTLLRRRGVRRSQGIPLEVSYLFFNFENRFLGRLPVRQAVALAIDRPRVVEHVERPSPLIADSPLPPSFPESASIDPTWDLGRHDPERARRILAAAGFPGGEGLPEFILDCPGPIDALGRRAAEGILADLEAVGIRAQIRSDPFPEFLGRAAAGETQIGWVRWYADYPDAENFLILFRSHEDPLATYNYGQYANPEYDALYDEMKVLYPGPERTALIKKMVGIVRKDVAWVPLHYPRHTMVVQKDVQGFRYNVLDLSLRRVR